MTIVADWSMYYMMKLGFAYQVNGLVSLGNQDTRTEIVFHSNQLRAKLLPPTMWPLGHLALAGMAAEYF